MHAKREEMAVLLKKAEHDLRTAQVMLSEGLYDIVCFHAQQAVEKSLKALLMHHNRPYPFKHDLGELMTLLPELPEPIEDLQDALKELTPFATTQRYESLVEPDLQFASEAVQLARAVYEAISDAVEEHSDNEMEGQADDA